MRGKNIAEEVVYDKPNELIMSVASKYQQKKKLNFNPPFEG
jgi:hypothetical protein